MKWINHFLTFAIFISSVIPMFPSQSVLPQPSHEQSLTQGGAPSKGQSQEKGSKKKRKKLRYVTQETPQCLVNEYTAESHDIRVHIKQYPLIGKPIQNKQKKSVRRKKCTSFYPLEIVIENKSAKGVSLTPETFGLEIIDYTIIAQKMVKTNAVRNLFIGSGIVPFASAGVGAALAEGGAGGMYYVLGAMAFGVIGVAISLGVLTLGLPIAFYSKHRAYAQNKEILEQCVLHDECTIKPGETVRKFVFINELDYQQNFSLHLEKSSGERVSFDVQLTQSKLVKVDDTKFSLGKLYE